MPNETKQSCATAYKTMIGGQALIEGIMMLGPEKTAGVVRKPDGGLEEQVEERVLIKDKHPALGLPLLRGVFNFCSSLATGVPALRYSASFCPEDEEEPEEAAPEDEEVEVSSAFLAFVPLETMRLVGSVRVVARTAETVTLPSMVSW